jgi:hypothetical protein
MGLLTRKFYSLEASLNDSSLEKLSTLSFKKKEKERKKERYLAVLYALTLYNTVQSLIPFMLG